MGTNKVKEQDPKGLFRIASNDEFLTCTSTMIQGLDAIDFSSYRRLPANAQ